MKDNEKNPLEFKDLYKHKVDLIQKAIDDTQNTIRFTDTKAAAVIGFWGIVSSILIKISDSWETWFSNFQITAINVIILAMLMVMAYFLVKSVTLAYLVVVPKTNPINHVMSNREARNIYFLSSLSKSLKGKYLYRISENIKLDISTQDYCEKMNKLDHEELMYELALELQKVSFIRIIKVTRANAAITSVINFLIVLMIFLLFLAGNEIALGSIKTMVSLKIDIDLLAVLVVGHLIADYLFQTDKQASRKQNEWIPLVLHCLVYTIILSSLSYFILGKYNWSMSFLFFLTHIIIDKGDIVIWWAKRVKGINNTKLDSLKSIIATIDQTFHYIVIFVVCLLY